MTTNIVHSQLNSKYSQSIPSGEYCIDSFKLSIDKHHFLATNIPENFTLIESDSGAIISEFKKNSISVKYGDTTVYIGLFKHILKKVCYEKVLILFSSKVCGSEYFGGIKKHHVIEVLEFLKEANYIDFKDVNSIYREIRAKDLDIKMDTVFDKKIREKASGWQKELKERFQYEKNEIHTYNSDKNFGLQAFGRDRSTLSKPFVKFYDKTKELLNKHQDFFKTLPKAIQNQVRTKFIYRYEFTMKDKRFFDKFGISNLLQDILEVPNTKWREIGVSLLNANFQAKIKKIRDTTKLKPIERILALQFHIDIHENKLSPMQIRTKYVSPQKGKLAKNRAGKLWEKIYQYESQDHSKEVANSYKDITYFDNIFFAPVPSV